MVETHGDLSQINVIVTAERGYGKEMFVRIMQKGGFYSIFVIPDPLTSMNPFMPESLQGVDETTSCGDVRQMTMR